MVSLIAIGLNALHLDDKTRSPGLPGGSVRAMIAFLLIVIQVIISMLLFTFVAGLSPGTQISQDGTAFALAFYTTMSALVSVLAVFYFGSSAKSRQACSKPAAAEISTIFPPREVASTSLSIMGKNFYPHAVASLRRNGHEPLNATAPGIIDTTIVCSITSRAAGMHCGNKWSATVTNPDGTFSTHSEKGVFTIN
jgi:hypothetical protein